MVVCLFASLFVRLSYMLSVELSSDSSPVTFSVYLLAIVEACVQLSEFPLGLPCIPFAFM